jgi:CheY-like chemotaxis protein
MIEETTKRGSDLIKQVLSFARGIEGERTIIQIQHVLDETRKIIKETFPRSIQLTVEFQKYLPTILGDITQLHQVVMNLCVNARDAMPQGGTLVLKGDTEVLDEHFIKMNMEGQLGQHLVLSVSDTGTGIPQSILDRIFEPFFSTKEPGMGTGLGLATVHAIVKSHNGFIKVHSTVGKGTTFKIYLPAQQGHVAYDTTDTTELQQGNSELILVVDDESSIREITKTTLEGNGYRVILASDGTEALELYKAEGANISVIVTDMMMPRMGGAALIMEIRRINPNVKVLAVSGLQEDVELLQNQYTRFLNKPYTSEKLIRTLEELLRKK